MIQFNENGLSKFVGTDISHYVAQFQLKNAEDEFTKCLNDEYEFNKISIALTSSDIKNMPVGTAWVTKGILRTGDVVSDEYQTFMYIGINKKNDVIFDFSTMKYELGVINSISPEKIAFKGPHYKQH